jgi:hypothetical protein
MEHLVAGFFGAWLLFAGPLYQANLELRAEDVEVDRIRAAKEAPAPDEVSKGWWLVPPVHRVLRRRRQEAHNG